MLVKTKGEKEETPQREKKKNDDKRNIKEERKIKTYI